MPEIKLFVTDDPKKPSKPNEKESKLDEEKQSDEQDVKIQQTKNKLKLKSVPIVSPKKKKKKGRAEVSTFISKPNHPTKICCFLKFTCSHLLVGTCIPI